MRNMDTFTKTRRTKGSSRTYDLITDAETGEELACTLTQGPDAGRDGYKIKQAIRRQDEWITLHQTDRATTEPDDDDESEWPDGFPSDYFAWYVEGHGYWLALRLETYGRDYKPLGLHALTTEPGNYSDTLRPAAFDSEEAARIACWRDADAIPF